MTMRVLILISSLLLVGIAQADSYEVGQKDKKFTKDSLERSKIYQVVEAERRAKPDTKKSSLNK